MASGQVQRPVSANQQNQYERLPRVGSEAFEFTNNSTSQWGSQGNVEKVFRERLDGAEVRLEGRGGRNYIFQGALDNCDILIRGVGGNNYIFQGPVSNSVVRIEGSDRNNVIFQSSFSGSGVRVDSAGGDLCLFQGLVKDCSIKDRGQREEARFIFTGRRINSELVYRQESSSQRQGQ